MQVSGGRLRLLSAIDRTSKLAFACIVESADKMQTADFLRELFAAVPKSIHTGLTDNGVLGGRYASAQICNRFYAEQISSTGTSR